MTSGDIFTWACAASAAVIAGIGSRLVAAPPATPSSPTAYLTDPGEIVRRVALRDSKKRSGVEEFTVMRKYVLHNSRMKHDAVMVVKLSYRKGRGKSFQILETHGAEGLSRRVLDRVLQGEVESSAPGREDSSRLTPEHYNFHLLGMEAMRGRACYVLELSPRFSSRYLIYGKAWIDGQDFATVRMDGRPSASFGFLPGKPHIVQEFQPVGEFYMASYSRSQSESFFLGASELTIEYSDYELRTVEGERMALRRCSAIGAAND